MSLKKKLIFLSVIFVLIISIGCYKYYKIQLNSLQKLGYTQEQSKYMITPLSIYHIVSNNKEELETNIKTIENKLDDLGVKQVDANYDNLVSKYNHLANIKDQKNEFMKKEVDKYLELAKTLKIKYDVQNKPIAVQYKELHNLLTDKVKKINDKNIKFLKANGYSKKEIAKLNGKDIFTTYNNILKARSKVEKEIKQNQGFASKNIKDAAMRMFNQTNQYRQSLGLKPYKYNYAMQACVFKEAKAYATNKNPHNWLCKAAANENAGLASSRSDYVGAAMTFFKNDPPHEAVLSGNYNSVAIAIVEKNGMMYMIMDVFH